CVRIQSNFDFW
nr:immunoglobulin heavy chain junction region [Macaca mulatta]MOX04238.1 immunoglobulin heavy chain junction region [Macaca mulatta]